MRKSAFYLFAFATVGFLNLSAQAANEAPKKLGEYGDWKAFSTTEGGKKVCYMISFPKKEEGDFKKRDKAYTMITHRPAMKSLNVISVHAGYPFAKDAKVDVSVKVGKTDKPFTLFTEGETAWAQTDKDDAALTTCIAKQGDAMVVSATSAKGTKSKDTYSLKGSTAAYNAICAACEVKP